MTAHSPSATSHSHQEEEVDTYLKAVERYLTDNKGKQYHRSGQVCIPYYTVVGVDESNADDIGCGATWVDNYNISGDTLLSVYVAAVILV